MSFKLLQFSPQESTRVIRMQAIPEQWSGPAACSSEIGFLKLFVEDEQTIVEKRIELGRYLWPGSVPGSKCWFLDVGWGNRRKSLEVTSFSPRIQTGPR